MSRERKMRRDLDKATEKKVDMFFEEMGMTEARGGRFRRGGGRRFSAYPKSSGTPGSTNIGLERRKYRNEIPPADQSQEDYWNEIGKDYDQETEETEDTEMSEASATKGQNLYSFLKKAMDDGEAPQAGTVVKLWGETYVVTETPQGLGKDGVYWGLYDPKKKEVFAPQSIIMSGNKDEIDEAKRTPIKVLNTRIAAPGKNVPVTMELRHGANANKTWVINPEWVTVSRKKITEDTEMSEASVEEKDVPGPHSSEGKKFRTKAKEAEIKGNLKKKLTSEEEKGKGKGKTKLNSFTDIKTFGDLWEWSRYHVQDVENKEEWPRGLVVRIEGLVYVLASVVDAPVLYSVSEKEFLGLATPEDANDFSRSTSQTYLSDKEARLPVTILPNKKIAPPKGVVRSDADHKMSKYRYDPYIVNANWEIEETDWDEVDPKGVAAVRRRDTDWW